MDPYLVFLAIGAVGLGAMALSGFSHHGSAHGGHAGHVGDGTIGHAHAGDGSTGHALVGDTHGGHAVAGAHAHSAGHAAHGHHGAHPTHDDMASSFLVLMSPRFLFSISLGLGTAGLVLRPVLGGVLLFFAALGAGAVFERILVRPIWNFAFRFESQPALTLESAAGSEATAVGAFDANGQGLIAVEVDGQVVQLLGTLRASDREYRARVPAGTRLRVEEVDAARNRCTVSLI